MNQFVIRAIAEAIVSICDGFRISVADVLACPLSGRQPLAGHRNLFTGLKRH